MELENYFSLGWSTPQHLFSGLFALAMVIKILSTFVLLYHRHVGFLACAHAYSNAWWWATKISALVLCAAAVGLSWVGQDQLGQRFFGGLFVLACCMVAVMLRKRMAGSPAAPAKVAPKA